MNISITESSLRDSIKKAKHSLLDNKSISCSFGLNDMARIIFKRESKDQLFVNVLLTLVVNTPSQGDKHLSLDLLWYDLRQLRTSEGMGYFYAELAETIEQIIEVK